MFGRAGESTKRSDQNIKISHRTVKNKIPYKNDSKVKEKTTHSDICTEMIERSEYKMDLCSI